MNIFLQHLRDPEYMHVLLNPLPVYGLSIAVIGLALALIFRNRTAIIIALALVFISGLSAWPVLSYGQAAYDRVKTMSDPAGEQWLDEHMARGEKLIYAFYVLAALAAAGVLLPIKWSRTSTPLATTTLVLGFVTLAIGGWIAYAGGHIRHKEFRFEPPPVAKAEGHGEQPKTESSPAPPMQMDHAGAGQTPPAAAEAPKSEDEQKQLEASRLQLEASRKQLEASKKQLEAAEAAKKQSPSPGAQQPQPSPEQRQ